MKTKELSDEEIKARIGAYCHDAFVEQRKLKSVQRPKGTLGYRDMDLSGLWIYEAPDGMMWGMNCETPERLRQSCIEFLTEMRDFPNSLDAMHEAEKVLTKEQQGAYYHHLMSIVTDGNGTDWAWRLLHASARQRALAFLATITP